jgi:antitoxin ParD1/3/4
MLAAPSEFVAAHSINLANFCQSHYSGSMTTMNISLPDTLKAFVDAQVVERGYGTSSEYVRELIRTDQDRRHLRGLLLQGAASAPDTPVDAAYFDALRQRVKAGTASGSRA